MLVYVINKNNQPMMPCSPRKARILLKEKKAKIVKYEPFTIQLIYGSSGYKQRAVMGIDTGAKNVGIAIVSEQGKVLYQSEIKLRQDIRKNMDTRRILRRSRRYRKTRYRKPKFNNRIRPKGWLPPTLKSKVNVIIGTYDRLSKIIPITEVKVEIAKFDIQKLQNPNISGVQYQQGQTYGYYNVRHYVFARDNYTCQICKKNDNKPLITHHVIPRSKGGTDRPDILVTLHADCHIAYHLGKFPKVKFNYHGKQYKEATHVTAMKNKLVKLLKKRVTTKVTFGNITKATRTKFGLKKHHYTDAIAITGIYPKKPLDVLYMVRQVRKKKRSLHESIPRKGRKEPNRTAKRNAKNIKEIIVNGKKWCLHDKVYIPELDEIGFISGFSGKQVYVQNIEGEYLQISKKYKQISSSKIILVCRNNNYIMRLVFARGSELRYLKSIYS